jgi:hypothetical protein
MPASEQPALFDVNSPVEPPLSGDDDPAVLDDMGAELDDTGAEPDDSEPAPAGNDDDEDTAVVTGVCQGGPYHGCRITSRYPKGFLLVDKARSRAYVYDHDGAVTFLCRDPQGAPLDDAGRWRAAEEPAYDVLALDIEVTAGRGTAG